MKIEIRATIMDGLFSVKTKYWNVDGKSKTGHWALAGIAIIKVSKDSWEIIEMAFHVER